MCVSHQEKAEGEPKVKKEKTLLGEDEEEDDKEDDESPEEVREYSSRNMYVCIYFCISIYIYL